MNTPYMDDERGLRERKKAQTREAIIKAALGLFSTRGYDETSTEEIAAAAQVAPRTFFRYFPTKEDVVFPDREDEDRRFREAFAERRRGESDLQLVARAITSAVLPSRPVPHADELEALVERTPSLRVRSHLMAARWEPVIREALLGAKRRSTREVIRAHLLAAGVPPALRAALRAWQTAGARGPAQAYFDEAVTMLAAGLER